MNIKYELTKTPKEKPCGALGFGQIFTDHMFIMDYSKENGWHDARIVPYQPLLMEPSSLVFHYAQECFEGLKAYRTPTGDIQLFRPDKNAQRMQSTHNRLCIPEIPVEDFVDAVKAIVKVDRDWVPSEPDTSLYIRPFTIATEPVLGVKAADNYKFIVICSPSGAYYEEGVNPVKIYVEDEYVRSAPGGTGHIKCGGNYAASIIASEKAHKLGFSQVLWLDGLEKKYIEEVGSMNIMFKIDGEIYTAPANVTVLPGITRLSCIELLKKWGYKVNEERFTIDFIIESAKNGKVEEVFGTGTAAVISPVGSLTYKGTELTFNNFETGEVTQRLYDTLTGMQFGKTDDTMNWTLRVE